MNRTSSFLGRRSGLAGPARGRRARRWLLTAPFLGCLTAAALLLAPPLASADTSSTLTVIGTSDVSDSGLIPNVIQPGFEKAFPQYKFKYIGTGTGNAIAMAESGAAGCRKSGPTAQLAKSVTAARAVVPADNHLTATYDIGNLQR